MGDPLSAPKHGYGALAGIGPYVSPSSFTHPGVMSCHIDNVSVPFPVVCAVPAGPLPVSARGKRAQLLTAFIRRDEWNA